MRIPSPPSVAKDRIQEQLVQQGRIGAENERLATQDLEANTESRHSSFSCVKSAVMPFEEREGVEGDHTPETDLTRCHQVLEEGDEFE